MKNDGMAEIRKSIQKYYCLENGDVAEFIGLGEKKSNTLTQWMSWKGTKFEKKEMLIFFLWGGVINGKISKVNCTNNEMKTHIEELSDYIGTVALEDKETLKQLAKNFVLRNQEEYLRLREYFFENIRKYYNKIKKSIDEEKVIQIKGINDNIEPSKIVKQIEKDFKEIIKENDEEEEAGESEPKEEEAGEPEPKEGKAKESEPEKEEAGEPEPEKEEAGEPEPKEGEAGEPEPKEGEAGEPESKEGESEESEPEEIESKEPESEDVIQKIISISDASLNEVSELFWENSLYKKENMNDVVNFSEIDEKTDLESWIKKGNCLFNGFGIKKDLKKAEECYQEVIKHERDSTERSWAFINMVYLYEEKERENTDPHEREKLRQKKYYFCKEAIKRKNIIAQYDVETVAWEEGPDGVAMKYVEDLSEDEKEEELVRGWAYFVRAYHEIRQIKTSAFKENEEKRKKIEHLLDSSDKNHEPRAQYGWGEYYYGENDKKAAKYFERYINYIDNDKDKENKGQEFLGDALYKLGEIKLNEGAVSDANSLFYKSARYGHADSFYRMGEYYRSENQNDRAFQCFEFSYWNDTCRFRKEALWGLIDIYEEELINDQVEFENVLHFFEDLKEENDTGDVEIGIGELYLFNKSKDAPFKVLKNYIDACKKGNLKSIVDMPELIDELYPKIKDGKKKFKILQGLKEISYHNSKILHEVVKILTRDYGNEAVRKFLIGEMEKEYSAAYIEMAEYCVDSEPEEKIIKWLEKAAKYGSGKACAILEKIYEEEGNKAKITKWSVEIQNSKWNRQAISREALDDLRKKFKPDTRVELILVSELFTGDSANPFMVKKGKVSEVDQFGNVEVIFDDGSSMSIPQAENLYVVE